MHIRSRALLFVCTLAMAAACASSAKLAQKSNESLAKGDLRKAYDQALRAVEKDEQNQAARQAYRAASTELAADYRARIVASALADTIAGANLALEFRRFRAEVAQHQTLLEPVAEFDRAEQAILTGAARAYYRRGTDAMAAGRPRLAVDEFMAVRRYDENHSDVNARLDDARRDAVVRVALLPFTDRIGVPGLAQEIADTVQRQLTRRARDEFRFTQIVSGAELERTMTVAESRNPTMQNAVEIGRRVGAQLVVTGRFRGLRTTASQRVAKFTLYQRFDQKDSAGTTTTRWDSFVLPIVSRQRDVALQFEIDVIDVATGAVVEHREEAAQTIARVVWTDFSAQTPYDRYAFLAPDIRRADSKREKAAEDAWRDEMGSWDLRDFLRQSRDQRARSRYATRYRGEFYANTRETPVWLGELPSENEMVFVALRDVWREVVAALKALDSKT